MAAIGRIRQHGALLVVIIGFAMLAFILTSSIDDLSGLFRGNQTKVGEIEGVNIDLQDYEKQVDRLTTVYKMETGRNDVDEEATSYIREQVWQNMVNKYTLEKQADKIGLHVTGEELAEVCFGPNAHQFITQRFGTGENARQNWQIAYNEEIEDENMRAQVENFKTYWEYCENVVALDRLQSKYNELLTMCVTANSLDAKFAFETSKKSVNVEYVVKPYIAIEDDKVSVSEKEIKARFEKNKEMYRIQKPTRTVKYITFDLKPSEQDKNEVRTKVENLMEAFANAEDVAAITNQNSDIAYNGLDYSEATIPAEWKEFAFGKDAKAGKVSELIFANDMYQVARLVKTGYSRPDSVRLQAVAEDGQLGQDFGWMTEEYLPEEVAEKAFACKKGERFTTGTGDRAMTFAVADISKATPKVKMAILAREIYVSDRTKTATRNLAIQFINENKTIEKFEDAADSLHYYVRTSSTLTDVTPRVDNLKASREIVKWAFEAKEGKVSSEAYLCDDQYVVVALEDANKTKFMPLDQVSGELRYELTNEKKAKLIKKDLKDVATLEAAAEALGADIQLAENVTFASGRFGNLGNEPAVVGAASTLEEGAVSGAIEGENGVYVIKVGTPIIAEADFNADAQIQMLNMYTRYMLPRQASMLIQKEAKIEDNRAKFY